MNPKFQPLKSQESIKKVTIPKQASKRKGCDFTGKLISGAHSRVHAGLLMTAEKLFIKIISY